MRDEFWQTHCLGLTHGVSRAPDIVRRLGPPTRHSCEFGDEILEYDLKSLEAPGGVADWTCLRLELLEDRTLWRLCYLRPRLPVPRMTLHSLLGPPDHSHSPDDQAPEDDPGQDSYLIDPKRVVEATWCRDYSLVELSLRYVLGGEDYARLVLGEAFLTNPEKAAEIARSVQRRIESETSRGGTAPWRSRK